MSERSDMSRTSVKPTEDVGMSSPVCSLMRSSSGDLARTTSSDFLALSLVSAARPMASAFSKSPG